MGLAGAAYYAYGAGYTAAGGALMTAAAYVPIVGGAAFGGYIVGGTVGHAVTEWTDNKAVGVGAGTLAGAGTGALIGAGIGSVIPGVGTAVGAVVGGIVGGIAGFIGSFW
jgi:hypothetical protein